MDPDAGFAQHGVCRPDLLENQPRIGESVNFDGTNVGAYGGTVVIGAINSLRGGRSYKGVPSCAVGLYCDVTSDAGAGTCKRQHSVETGQACNRYYLPCRTRSDVCLASDGTCQPLALGTTGAACRDDSECEATFHCQASDGGRVCVPRVTRGGACKSAVECADYLFCTHGICGTAADFSTTVPVCE